MEIPYKVGSRTPLFRPREAPPEAARMMHPASLPSSSGGDDEGGSDSDGHDHISELPDHIKGSILSLLPLKDAGRTTKLSRHWKGVFAGSPISLDDEHVSPRRVGRPRREVFLHAERVKIISRILKKHTGPIPRVRLAKTHFYGNNGYGLNTNAFAKRGVKELIVHSTDAIRFFPAPPLRSVTLVKCDWFPTEQPLPPVFAGIKELSLHAVRFSAADVHALLEQCVQLECLLLSSYHKDEKDRVIDIDATEDCRTLQIRSRSLRSLFLEILGLEGVDIVDAPNLERLLGEVSFDKSYCQVTLVNAPKLQILGFLTMSLPRTRIVFEDIKMMGMILEPSRPIHSIKILGLCLDLCNPFQVDQMMQVLNYFPCVETLNIKIFTNASIRHTLYSEAPYANLLEMARRIDCLRDSIKTIVLSDLWLHTDTFALQFAKILLESAKKLQLMKIFHVPVDKKKQARSTRRRLGLKRDPSIKVRVVFPRDYISYRQVSDVLMGTSSLAMPNPMFYQRTFQSSHYIRMQWNSYLKPVKKYF
ncbi:unnamed protein product [Urochloa decumbens]|uniref:F-box domain-containing protein n=1 Tax=Urochloa decumbens TaxID=240449 RepID=A0ABC8VPG6_9POAL